MLNNLGTSLFRRFEQLGDLTDINNSVLMNEHAVQLTPDGHPDKPAILSNLGNLLSHRFEQLQDPQDSQQLLLYFTSAACSTTGPASTRFKAAKMWAKHAHIHQPSSILCAYTTAIELLPELAWLGLSITDRHHRLSQAGQVVRDAASAAIAVQDYQKAVEWLDQGRSVIWETAGTRSNSVADGIKPQSLESIAEQSHDLALKRNRVLQQIRALPGFERFLLPKPISELSLAAKNGPVANLNTSAYGCDALILRPDLANKVIHVPLSNFTIREAEAFTKSLASIVGTPDAMIGCMALVKERWLQRILFPYLSELWLKLLDFNSSLSLNRQPRDNHTSQELEKKLNASSRNVQKGMKDSRWVHFACHGVQSASPTESALLLAGSSRLTLSSIINLSLPNADLAFLSACQTATGSQKLQDESVHLTAGMLLAGYRGVIGTMWSIMDHDAPQVASDVYAHLLEGSSPDPTRAAEALHLAIRKLREQSGGKKSFLHWVPFIHFGV
ncbi:CHAT domain-containing protein [Mycena leptocephala]|nr:CHAT domain-containing protein [Mycena leptocephala]